MKKEKSIITQTVIRISAICIVMILLLSVLFAIYMGMNLRKNIMESREEQLGNISSAMESLVDSLTYPIVSFAKYNPTERLLSDYNHKYSVEWMENIRNLNVFLTNVSMFNGYIIDINLVRPDSEVAYSMNETMKRDYLYVEQDWFQKALQNDGIIKYAPPHGNDHYYKHGNMTSFSAFYPLYRSNQLIGYVLVDCDLSQIAEFFHSEKGMESGFILLDAQNEIIFDYNQKRKSGEIVSGEVLSGLASGEKLSFQENGNMYIASRLQATNWVILSETDSQIITRPLLNLIGIVLLVIATAIILIIMVARYSGKIIERPFNALIERIVSYDGSSSVEVDRFDHAPRELVVIRKRFERMAYKINTLINDVYIAKLSRKEMELEALTNQINPHFIYNVFQLIQTKAVIAENYEVEDMIQVLSNMMRYTMERSKEKVRIAEELKYIEYYLMFYKERFSTMFDYEILCDEEVKRCMTIKFILQPIVENCFKHAFKNCKEDGMIRIAVVARCDDIILTIRDNGCGIGVVRLKRLCTQLSDNLTEGGIGIVNTNARVRLVYGQPYQLTIDSQENEYTEVKIIIRREEDYDV